MDIKNTISSTEARQHFARVIEEVEKTGARYLLTVNGKPKVALINAEELESILETLDILSDAGTMARLQQSEKELTAGDSLPLDELLANGI